MKRYVCIDEKGEMSIKTESEILNSILSGALFQEIYELGRKMEIQIKLVPAKKQGEKREVVEDSDSSSEAEPLNNGKNKRKQTRRGREKNLTLEDVPN